MEYPSHNAQTFVVGADFVYFKEGARVLTVTAWRGVFRFSGMGAW